MSLRKLPERYHRKMRNTELCVCFKYQLTHMPERGVQDHTNQMRRKLSHTANKQKTYILVKFLHKENAILSCPATQVCIAQECVHACSGKHSDRAVQVTCIYLNVQRTLHSMFAKYQTSKSNVQNGTPGPWHMTETIDTSTTDHQTHGCGGCQKEHFVSVLLTVRSERFEHLMTHMLGF